MMLYYFVNKCEHPSNKKNGAQENNHY